LGDAIAADLKLNPISPSVADSDAKRRMKMGSVLRKHLAAEVRAWTADEIELEAMRYAVDATSLLLDRYTQAELLVHQWVDEVIDRLTGSWGKGEPDAFLAGQKMLFDLLTQYWARASHVASKGMSLRLSSTMKDVATLLAERTRADLVAQLEHAARTEELSATAIERLRHEVVSVIGAASNEKIEDLAADVRALALDAEANDRLAKKLFSFGTTQSMSLFVNLISPIVGKAMGIY
jgi:hypothetical protein